MATEIIKARTMSRFKVPKMGQEMGLTVMRAMEMVEIFVAEQKIIKQILQAEKRRLKF